MKAFVILFSFMLATAVHGQSSKRYTFQKIGWTLDLPAGFEVSDSSGLDDSDADAQQAMVLIIAYKANNNFNAVITPFNSREEGPWVKSFERTKEESYLDVKKAIPGIVLDTASSRITIDGLVFEKYVTVLKQEGKVVVTDVRISRFYKGYDFGLTYSYCEEAVKNEIEAMLAASKFKK